LTGTDSFYPKTCIESFTIDAVTGVVTYVYGYCATSYKLQLYTMIFNTFVFMQVFNEINSRKLGEHEYNVFVGFFNNPLFLLIMLFTIVVQMAMVEYGG